MARPLSSPDRSSAHPSEGDGAAQPAAALAPGLYLVATPIGNLRDITLRALDVLRGAAGIACEDTRVTAKLLNAYGIKKPLLAYHEHNAAEMRPVLLERLGRGEALALVSDAGTPLVSDPGYKLVEACIEAGVAVVPVPGPSAVLAALSGAGLPTDRFLFAGFSPPKQAARRRFLAELGPVPATLILFETGPRLAAMLADALAMLGDRRAAVGRELTKFYEEFRRGTLKGLAESYAEAAPPKGEIVVLIEGAGAETAAAAVPDLDAALREALGQHSLKQAVAEVSARLGLKRRDVYAAALRLTAKP
jgi:16S rRNA (cytidine1402-2'-O)-methyltransferase